MVRSTQAGFQAVTYQTRVNGMAWSYRLLPFLDQSTLYQHLNGLTWSGTLPTATAEVGANAKLSAVFKCPSDAPSEPGNSGLGSYIGTYDASGLIKYVAAAPTSQVRYQLLQKNGGMFGVNVARKLRDVTDGSSNTFFVGERAYHNGSTFGTIYPLAVRTTNSGSPASSVPVFYAFGGGNPNRPSYIEIAAEVSRCVKATQNQADCNTTILDPWRASEGFDTGTFSTAGYWWDSFNSAHGSGMSTMLHVDGSVRLLNLRGMDIEVYNNLVTRDDGNVIGQY